MHADGGGLYLQISGKGAKSWIFRYSVAGRTHDMGLGSLSALSLGDARTKAAECRALRAAAIDPIEHRDAQRRAAALEAASAIPFSECAERFIAGHSAGWSNPKHREQWTNTLKTYAYPIIGDTAVGSVNTGHVVRILEPIWATKTETATRVRGRIEAILDWAKVREYRTGENPARWRGHLDHILPKPSKVRKVRHHPALKIGDIGSFVADLRARDSTSARALEFLILTAARSGEVIYCKPAEVNLSKKVWTVPAVRMKNRKEHRVPLCDRAVEIIETQRRQYPKASYLFPGQKDDSPLSTNALEMLVRRMNGKSDPPKWRDVNDEAIVPHGCRSTFRDWASERTGFSREVIELSLAHTTEDKTEAAYFRSTLFEKRQRLMRDWAEFCAVPIRDGSEGDNVVPLHGRQEAL
jgi:integrase